MSSFDFDATQRTATRRGSATGIYTGTCLTVPDPSRLFADDLYSGGQELEIFPVASSGLPTRASPSFRGDVLQQMNCTKADGNVLVGEAGGVASLSMNVPSQVGTFEGVANRSNYGSGIKDFAPDESLGRTFFLTSADSNAFYGFDTISAFGNTTFLRTDSLSLPFSTVEGATETSSVDLVRWGQDGLAILTSSGRLYLLRGPVVVPDLLHSNSAALVSTTSPALVHGGSNVQLTVNGSNFLPGAAASWNGVYRTTTVLDSTTLSVAIPFTDLLVSGTATLTVTNPGSPASQPLSVQIQ